MLKKFSLFFTAVVLITAVMAGCKDSVNPIDPGQEEAELQPLELSVPRPVEDLIFFTTPTFTIHIGNPNTTAVTARTKSRIVSDKGKEVASVLLDVEVPAGSEKDIEVSLPSALEPGFYKSAFFVDGKTADGFNFGVSPYDIVSAPDKQPDFDSFWEAAITQLEGVEMNAQLTEITSRSSEKRKVYLVEMNSVPDGLTGEPVIVRGYYVEPQDGKKHPVIMHYFGYDDQKPTSKADCPYGGGDDTFAEFYMSTRGQMLNNRTAALRVPDGKGDFVNTYGDWFAFQFGNRDGYYYRGAFMDVVQAIRFMATRPTSDMNNVFAEGSSQGGALSYAAAALSPYPFRAIAPCVAFLGDFPDYFEIASWPASTARTQAKKESMSDAEMYAFLSYFDTKNLATRISCAVIACSGLQDQTCPPHTNIAPFNNLLSTDKQYYFYPKLGHQIPAGWNNKYMAFFKERIQE